MRMVHVLALWLLVVPLPFALVSQVAAGEGVGNLVKDLKNKDELVRLKAAKALGKLGVQAKDAIPALTEALKDEDLDVRAVAKRSLDTIQSASTEKSREGAVAELEKLVTAAKDKDREVRQRAALGLARLLEDQDEIVRLKAARTLSEMGLDASGAEKALGVAVKDGDAGVRKMARKALDQIAEAAAVAEADRQRAALEPLLAELKAADPKKRIKAIEKIAEMGPKAAEAGQDLVQAMMDKQPQVRNKAAEALEAVDPDIHRNVLTLYIGQNKEQALHAVGAMGARGRAALPAVLYVFSNHPADNQYNQLNISAMTVMRQIAPDDKRVARAILTAVSQTAQGQGRKGTRVRVQHDYLRLAAIKNLDEMDINAKDKVSALISALSEQYCAIPAMHALGRMGPDASAAIPALRQLRSSNLDAVRDAASEAMKSIEK